MDIDPEQRTIERPAWRPPLSQPPAPPDDIFFGRFGLRAAWGIAIAVVLFYFLLSFFSALVPWTLLGQSSNGPAGAPLLKPALITVNGGIEFLSVALATLILSLLERRAFSTYGIGLRRLRDIVPGAFWGLVSLSLLIAALRACHLLVFDSRALAGRAIFSSGMKWLAAFLFVGLFEEYAMRGYLQFTLTRAFFHLAESVSTARARLIAFWIASLVTSVSFGLLHLTNGGETPFGILAVFLVGIVFSYALWRTGSLWWAIGFHLSWDWAQSFLYGVPDSGALSSGRLFFTHARGNPVLSGGIDGPEGSVLVLPTLLLVLLIVRFTARPGTQPSLMPASGHPTDETHTIVA